MPILSKIDIQVRIVWQDVSFCISRGSSIDESTELQFGLLVLTHLRRVLPPLYKYYSRFPCPDPLTLAGPEAVESEDLTQFVAVVRFYSCCLS